MPRNLTDLMEAAVSAAPPEPHLAPTSPGSPSATSDVVRRSWPAPPPWP